MIRSDFTPAEVNKAIAGRPRTHANMLSITEQLWGKGNAVARPGKTAHERARREKKATAKGSSK